MTKLVKDAERLKKIVRQFSEVSITVLADLVADEFVFGEIARVSREAPVLILKHRERTVVPGGGANAVMNLAALGVNVLPVGVVGDDEAGSLLLEKFREKKIAISGIERLQGYTTTTKTRILAGMSHTSRQQVVRVDREPEALGEMHPALLNLVNAAREYATASDAMLVSDYGYGAATPRLLTFVKSNGCVENKPITVDSRYRILDYEGATAATPNEPEVEEALHTRIGRYRELRRGKSGLHSQAAGAGRPACVRPYVEVERSVAHAGGVAHAGVSNRNPAHAAGGVPHAAGIHRHARRGGRDAHGCAGSPQGERAVGCDLGDRHRVRVGARVDQDIAGACRTDQVRRHGPVQAAFVVGRSRRSGRQRNPGGGIRAVTPRTLRRNRKQRKRSAAPGGRNGGNRPWGNGPGALLLRDQRSGQHRQQQ